MNNIDRQKEIEKEVDKRVIDNLIDIAGDSLSNINNEITQLEIEVEKIRNINPQKFEEFLISLIEVNTALWETEDAIRVLEQKQDFSHKFIELARSVYIQNDERFSIKNSINKFYKSGVVEEKDYVEY